MDISQKNDEGVLRVSVKGYLKDFHILEDELLLLVEEVRNKDANNTSTYGGYCLECGAMEMWKLSATRANLTFCDECAVTFADHAEAYAERNAGTLLGEQL